MNQAKNFKNIYPLLYTIREESLILEPSMAPQLITKKQHEILYNLYLFRYLNRPHIQTLLNHKDSARINKWLTDLTHKQYIHKIYSTNFGENTKPAIYYLATKSIKLLQDNPNVVPERLVRVYRERGRSSRFITHCLAVADVYTAFQRKESGSTQHFFTTKTELLDHDYLLQPVPDAYIALKNKQKTTRYFLEIFDTQIPRFVFKKRIQQYLEYAEDGAWEAETEHSFPKVLLVCLEESALRFLKRYLEDIEDDSNISFIPLSISDLNA